MEKCNSSGSLLGEVLTCWRIEEQCKKFMTPGCPGCEGQCCQDKNHLFFLVSAPWFNDGKPSVKPASHSQPGSISSCCIGSVPQYLRLFGPDHECVGPKCSCGKFHHKPRPIPLPVIPRPIPEEIHIMSRCPNIDLLEYPMCPDLKNKLEIRQIVERSRENP